MSSKPMRRSTLWVAVDAAAYQAIGVSGQQALMQHALMLVAQGPRTIAGSNACCHHLTATLLRSYIALIIDPQTGSQLP